MARLVSREGDVCGHWRWALPRVDAGAEVVAMAEGPGDARGGQERWRVLPEPVRWADTTTTQPPLPSWPDGRAAAPLGDGITADSGDGD